MTNVSNLVRVTNTSIQNNGNLLALCNIVIAESFEINGLRILKGTDNKPPFVAMPSIAKQKNGVPVTNLETGKQIYNKIFRPINEDSTNVITTICMHAYAAEVAKKAAQAASAI